MSTQSEGSTILYAGMDNLTHSLAGFASVEVLSLWKPQSRKTYLTAQITALLANNFPDIDILYTGIIPGKLGYLIHHRGHTHTVLLGTLLSLVLGCLGVWFLRCWAGTARRFEKRLIIGVALLGGLLHIFMDSWNIYGVHPFWPFSNRWFYGDAVFIVEPVIWLLLLPVVMMASLPRGIRILGGVTLAFVILVIFYTGYVLQPIAIVLVLAVPGLIGLARGGRYSVAMLGSVVASALTVFGFSALSVYLAQQVSARMSESALTIDDIMLSPLPANPFCWTLVVAFEDQAKGEVGMRRGIFTPFPWVPYSDCPRLRSNGSTAPLQEFKDLSGLSIHWGGEYRYPAESFRTLAKENCLVAKFLQMSRAPFVVEESESLILGDLRFDWEETLGFAEIRVPKNPESCPKWGAPWLLPRADWLSRSS